MASETVTLKVSVKNCQGCKKEIEKTLKKLKLKGGVDSSTINWDDNLGTISVTGSVDYFRVVNKFAKSGTRRIELWVFGDENIVKIIFDFEKSAGENPCHRRLHITNNRISWLPKKIVSLVNPWRATATAPTRYSADTVGDERAEVTSSPSCGRSSPPPRRALSNAICTTTMTHCSS